MSAEVELLRAAAKTMRERAVPSTIWLNSSKDAVVALAVADWLDYTADVVEHLAERGHRPAPSGSTTRALAVARAFLGRAER